MFDKIVSGDLRRMLDRKELIRSDAFVCQPRGPSKEPIVEMFGEIKNRGGLAPCDEDVCFIDEEGCVAVSNLITFVIDSVFSRVFGEWRECSVTTCDYVYDVFSRMIQDSTEKMRDTRHLTGLYLTETIGFPEQLSHMIVDKIGFDCSMFREVDEFAKERFIDGMIVQHAQLGTGVLWISILRYTSLLVDAWNKKAKSRHPLTRMVLYNSLDLCNPVLIPVLNKVFKLTNEARCGARCGARCVTQGEITDAITSDEELFSLLLALNETEHVP